MGKDTYDQAKSFRPITLTSYVFKGIEKLVYWHLEETTLRRIPYNKNQHAFRPGHSTESALSKIVNEIEKGTLRRGYTLAVFLDVAGAFDKLSFEAAKKALKCKQIKKEIKTWYLQYLENQTSIIELKNISRKIEIKTGCPQGGILSVLLWNITFDTLLKKITKGRVKCIGFADDGTLLIHGRDLKTMKNLMQKAINKVMDWANECNLKLSPNKTHAMLFTRKRKIQNVNIDLFIDGNKIEYVDTVKCLGITLDKRLNWNAHLDEKIKQAKTYLHLMKSSISRTWGPTPENMLWIWTAVIRPRITYASYIPCGPIIVTPL